MSEKMAPPKHRVRFICASKHATPGVKQKEIGGYRPRQSVPTSYGKLLAHKASENWSPNCTVQKHRSCVEEGRGRKMGSGGLPPGKVSGPRPLERWKTHDHVELSIRNERRIFSSAHWHSIFASCVGLQVQDTKRNSECSLLVFRFHLVRGVKSEVNCNRTKAI